MFVLEHVLVLSLGLGPDTYVDEYLWTLRPHNSPSKSCFLAHRVEMRILTCSGIFWASCVLSYASTKAFLTAQGMLLTLRSLESAFIKFWLLIVSHVLCCDVDWTAANPVGMGVGIFPIVPCWGSKLTTTQGPKKKITHWAILWWRKKRKKKEEKDERKSPKN